MYECPGPYLYKDGGAFVKSVEWGGGMVDNQKTFTEHFHSQHWNRHHVRK